MTVVRVYVVLVSITLATCVQRDAPEVSGKVAAQTSAAAQVEPSPPPAARTVPEPPEGMVYVAETVFFMGIKEEKSGADKGRLEKSGPIFIDRMEVTAEQYLKCKASGSCTEKVYEADGCNAAEGGERLQHPMNCVTWNEAQRYCAMLGKRLPTSAEWELAARGTDKRPFPWGTAKPKDQLCWQGRKGKARATTCPVGKFPQGASPYGVLDMAGNVAEWTSTVIPGGNPAPIYDTRGGGFRRDAYEEAEWPQVRADLRGGSNPVEHESDIGFRCAADVR